MTGLRSISLTFGAEGDRLEVEDAEEERKRFEAVRLMVRD